MFSYPGTVKSPEWRWQWRKANLWHFEIFRHGPIIIYTRLPAGGIYYPIPTNSECLTGISDAFSAFCLRVSIIFPTCSLYPQQKCAYSLLHPLAWTYMYRSMPIGTYQVQSPGFLKIVCCFCEEMVFTYDTFSFSVKKNLTTCFSRRHLSLIVVCAGVENAFSTTPHVMTVSFHKYDTGFFPGNWQ